MIGSERLPERQDIRRQFELGFGHPRGKSNQKDTVLMNIYLHTVLTVRISKLPC